MQWNLTKELLSQIREWIADGKDTALHEVTRDLHPADIGELINELRREEAVYLYRILDEERAADVMLELDEDVREKLLSSLTSREIADFVIDNIDSDDAADVISELPEEKQEEVIALLEDEEQASDIIDLLTYEEGTAGALMGTVWVQEQKLYPSKTDTPKEVHDAGKGCGGFPQQGNGLGTAHCAVD